MRGYRGLGSGVQKLCFGCYFPGFSSVVTKVLDFRPTLPESNYPDAILRIAVPKTEILQGCVGTPKVRRRTDSFIGILTRTHDMVDSSNHIPAAVHVL